MSNNGCPIQSVFDIYKKGKIKPLLLKTETH